jgi:hypothetical protein
MFSEESTNAPVTIQVMYFDIPECAASSPMQEAASRWARTIGAEFTSLDVWDDPDAVVEHCVSIGPAILVVADGVEIARLGGPRGRRSVERFLGKIPTTATGSVLAA